MMMVSLGGGLANGEPPKAERKPPLAQQSMGFVVLRDVRAGVEPACSPLVWEDDSFLGLLRCHLEDAANKLAESVRALVKAVSPS
jgi:hypothetical protein